MKNRLPVSAVLFLPVSLSLNVEKRFECYVEPGNEKNWEQMSKSICIYGASSNAVKLNFFETAHQLGKEIARRNYTLVFGGAEVGLMGAVASSVHKNGGKVIGVVPEILHEEGLSYQEADELIIVPNLRKRKAEMEKRSDAFIALPGGFGTLEEAFEMITLKQLGQHNKPIVFLNIDRFYEPLRALFEYWFRQNIVKETYRHLYYFSRSIEETFDYFDHYQPVTFDKKWF